MYILKIILLIAVFCTSTVIGYLISKRYSNRVQILKEIKSGLNIFAVKINFSCELISEIFEDISNKLKGTAAKIFSNTVVNMKDEKIHNAGEAWENAVENNSESLRKEDRDVLKTLGKLLGTTDVEGQVNQITLVNSFLEKQIEEAEDEKNKNEKMYRKLGVIVGLVLVIVLI